MKMAYPLLVWQYSPRHQAVLRQWRCMYFWITGLQLSSVPKSLLELVSLTTMEKEQSKSDCCIVSLEVLDLDEVNLIELPSVFTRKKLPVAAENVATQEDIDQWPHLSCIQLPKSIACCLAYYRETQKRLLRSYTKIYSSWS